MYITKEKWFSLPLQAQMSNIGADVGRSINWKKKAPERSRQFFEQALIQLDLTIEDKKNHTSSLKEICRLKEVLADYFLGSNIYGSTEKNLNNYFYTFSSGTTK